MAKDKQQDSKIKAPLRTPIVAVMGHVDHGKTSLLDAIRGTRVAAGEAGGITQNTRAHKVNVAEFIARENELAGLKTKSVEARPLEHITFIDTPGHEAFSEMRSRGARVADIAILVVAADDGVQPQTRESIKFIKAANLPLIIACNKIDAPGANTQKVKQELSQNDVLVEEFGGDVMFVEVSALKHEGLVNLVESIELLAEIHELRSTPPAQGEAEAFVLESNLDSDLGPVVLVILKSGEISKGQYVVSADMVHKIRATLDERQKQSDVTAQGDPVWLIGLKKVLPVGENLIFYKDENAADKLLKEIERSKATQTESIEEVLDDAAILEALLGAKQERVDTETTLKVILKADTQGTLEAIVGKLSELSFPNAKVSVFQANTGAIVESDVEMAQTIKGVVLGFQVDFTEKAMGLAKREKVLVRNYEIIYDLINEVEAVVNSMLQPEEEIVEVARARVKEVFTLTNGKQIAGCEVTMGTVIRGYKVFVERKGEEVGEGKITSLKHLKQDVKEVKKGIECGIMIEPQIDLQTDDFVVCYKVER